MAIRAARPIFSGGFVCITSPCDHRCKHSSKPEMRRSSLKSRAMIWGPSSEMKRGFVSGYFCLAPGRPEPWSDFLRVVAGAAGRPALFPQFFPIPDPVRHFVRQRESELMREHKHLPAMVGFV
jgi:hypothetical protein